MGKRLIFMKNAEDIENAEVITLECSLTTTMQAVMRHGEGGFRVTLDIPECYAEQVKRLMDWIQCTLILTIRRSQ